MNRLTRFGLLMFILSMGAEVDIGGWGWFVAMIISAALMMVED